jgi:hypothetical protein
LVIGNWYNATRRIRSRLASGVKRFSIWPSKRTKRMRKIMIIMVMFGLASCAQPPKEIKSQHEQPELRALSDEGQIRVLACEALVTNAIRQFPGTVLFIKLDGEERRVFMSRLRNFDIEPASSAQFMRGFGFQDTRSGRPGPLISVSDLKVVGQNAFTQVGFSWASPGGDSGYYKMELVKDPKWRITNIDGIKISK